MSEGWQEKKPLSQWENWMGLDFYFWLGYYRAIEFSDADKDVAIAVLETLNKVIVRAGLRNPIEFRHPTDTDTADDLKK